MRGLGHWMTSPAPASQCWNPRCYLPADNVGPYANRAIQRIERVCPQSYLVANNVALDQGWNRRWSSGVTTITGIRMPQQAAPHSGPQGKGKGRQMTNPVPANQAESGWQVVVGAAGNHTNALYSLVAAGPNFVSVNPWQALSSAASQMPRAPQGPNQTAMYRPIAGINYGSAACPAKWRNNRVGTMWPWHSPQEMNH